MSLVADSLEWMSREAAYESAQSVAAASMSTLPVSESRGASPCLPPPTHVVSAPDASTVAQEPASIKTAPLESPLTDASPQVPPQSCPVLLSQEEEPMEQDATSTGASSSVSCSFASELLFLHPSSGDVLSFVIRQGGRELVLRHLKTVPNTGSASFRSCRACLNSFFFLCFLVRFHWIVDCRSSSRQEV